MKDTIFVQPDEEGKLSKFKIGDQEFTQDDILSWKNGHMMQNDYTKKTQELANERRALEDEKKKAFSTHAGTADEALAREMALLKLEVKLNQLKAKYPSFDEMLVLDKAKRQLDNGMPVNLINYEEIWLSVKPNKSEDELKKEIREELMKEFQPDTDGIIRTGGAQSVGNQKLTQDEIETAKKLGITPEEYLKYKY